MKFHVIYRLCDKPEAVNRLPRPFSLTKKQVIGCCFPSIIESLEILGNAWAMTIICDDITDETKDFIKEITDKKAILTDITEEVKNTNKIPLVDDSLEKASVRTIHFSPPLKNVGSLLKAYEVADSLNEDKDETWIYFCEDDYLHDKNSFLPRLLDFISFSKGRNFAMPVFYHPTDYPDQYTRLLSRNYLFQALTGYFREVSSTTGTYICQLKTYKKFAEWIKNCSADDGKFSTIFRKQALCFSPIPGTATHMHEGVMSAYVDWSKIVYKV